MTTDDIELVDKEFITDQFDTYEADLVYKVRLKEKNIQRQDIYLFFLFELQSYNDFTMPFRLLVYIVAIWLDYFHNSDERERKKRGYRLPAVIPMVLYNGTTGWTASRNFRKMVENADMFGKYIVDFEYILVSLNKLTIEHIKGTNTLVDNILLADKNRGKEDWQNNFTELMRRVKAMAKADTSEWLTWFTNVMGSLNKEKMEQFVEAFKQGDEEGMCSSFERLIISERAEATVKTKAEDILELLEDYGEIPPSLKKTVLEQDNLNVLSKWLKLAARANSISNFEEAIGLVNTSTE